MEEVEKAVREVIGGVEYEDAFYRQILDKMVIYGHDRIDVFLNLLPFKWSYTISKASKCGGSTKRNISDASEGTEELAHLEMVAAILHQLTRNLSEEEIKDSPFATYFVDHTTGVYPVAASGVPFDMKYVGVKGDVLADLHEDLAAEQKARVTYDNILRLCDDPDVREPIKFLREREIVHYQRFADALRITQDNLDSKNFYACNPAFDKGCGKMKGC